MVNEGLVELYRVHRQSVPAIRAVTLARSDFQVGKRRYLQSDRGWGNHGFAAYGSRRLIWVESPLHAGLRSAGFSDVINPGIRHTGWYVSAERPGESTRGLVLQIPGHRRRSRYVAACTDPFNDGPVLCDVETLFSDKDDERARRDAAAAADDLARRYAEEARAYDEAWIAGNRYGELGIEAQSLRRSIRDAARYVKGEVLPEGVCVILQRYLREKLAELDSLRRQRSIVANGRDRHYPWDNADTGLAAHFRESAANV